MECSLVERANKFDPSGSFLGRKAGTFLFDGRCCGARFVGLEVPARFGFIARMMERLANYFEGFDDIVHEQYQVKCQALAEARELEVQQ